MPKEYYQVQFSPKGTNQWLDWAKKYATIQDLETDWSGEGCELNTSEFDFRVVACSGDQP